MNSFARSDQIASPSNSISMQFSSDYVRLGSTTDSEVKVGQETKNTQAPAHSAAELIRELSFSCYPVSSSSNGKSTSRHTMPKERSYHDCSNRHKLEALVAEECDQPTTTPPSLPPIIRRLELNQITDMPSNHPSTSISEMSDFNETGGDKDSRKSSTSLMHTSSGNHDDHIDVPRPVSWCSLAGSQNIVSCHSSYTSSSLSDNLIIENIAGFEMEGDGGAVLRKQVLCKPPLTSETLKIWDMLCEGIHPKDAFSIFRARSCPDKVPTAPLPCERGFDIDLHDCNNSVQESGIRHMISQSMFSYTNSGSSSITSSNEDVRSDLDFDVNLFAPIHIPERSV